MIFDELKRRLSHLKIDVDQKPDGVTYFKKDGNTWLLLEPDFHGKTVLRFNSDCILDAKSTHDFLGVLRIVNKYVETLKKGFKKQFCEDLANRHLESGEVIHTNVGDYLITWYGFIDHPHYSVVELNNGEESEYASSNLSHIAGDICGLAGKDSEKIVLRKIYRSLPEYYIDQNY